MHTSLRTSLVQGLCRSAQGFTEQISTRVKSSCMQPRVVFQGYPPSVSVEGTGEGSPHTADGTCTNTCYTRRLALCQNYNGNTNSEASFNTTWVHFFMKEYRFHANRKKAGDLQGKPCVAVWLSSPYLGTGFMQNFGSGRTA